MANVYQFFIHTVAVSRETSTNVSQRISDNWATLYSGLACLIEPTTVATRRTFFGRTNQPRFRMTWSPADENAVVTGLTPALQNGDRVVWNGTTYVLNEIDDDSSRMGFSNLVLKTGLLEQMMI